MGTDPRRPRPLRYYRSTDATITTSDTEVGTDEVPVLAPSGTSSQSVSLTAPSTAGTYYYGGCVDAVPGESDTTNNCIAHQVEVSPVSQGTPDLVVSASVSDSTPDPGATFTAVCDGAKRRGWIRGGHDAALLPVDGRDYHDKPTRRWARTQWRSLLLWGPAASR